MKLKQQKNERFRGRSGRVGNGITNRSRGKKHAGAYRNNTRYKVLAKYPICLKCGSTNDLTVDHIIPSSMGGSDKQENLQTLCKRCNNAKGRNVADYTGSNFALGLKVRKYMESESWHSYPSIYALGHKALELLFDGPVIVEEKVDGSQFSFGLFDGELRFKSKNQQIFAAAVPGMFRKGVEAITKINEEIGLHEGWTYRGEYLEKPHHNALTYNREPRNFVILFDINDGHESYLSYSDLADEATRIGLELVPALHVGVLKSANEITDFLQLESTLGGPKIEGVVIKNYAQFGADKKVLMGKLVSEAFKETHRNTWGVSNPTGADIIERIATGLRTDARWNKAIQHLKESDALVDSPRDIGPLMTEIKQDIIKEEKDQIKDALYKHYMEPIMRQALRGFPEWYKNHLVEQQGFPVSNGCEGTPPDSDGRLLGDV